MKCTWIEIIAPNKAAGKRAHTYIYAAAIRKRISCSDVQTVCRRKYQHKANRLVMGGSKVSAATANGEGRDSLTQATIQMVSYPQFGIEV